MPALPQHVLHAKLKAALPAMTAFTGPPNETRPALARIPGIGRARVYLWTITHVATTLRPQDEFKIQLILPGQDRGVDGALDLAQAQLTLLLGYSPDYGVFVGWDARLHEHFGYSATVQVKEDLLIEARDFGWSVAPPRRAGDGGKEVRVAFSAGNLLQYVSALKEADQRNLVGTDREAYFLSKTPAVAVPAPARLPPEEYVSQLRRRISTTRLERSSRFAALVKKQFSYSCALCGVQMNIVEAAHIIPVNEEGSEDVIWNGIAMCRNHHRLFDAGIFVIRPELTLLVDRSAVAFLEECGRATGVESLLEPFENESITPPLFFRTDRGSRKKMRAALEHRESLAAIGRRDA